MSTYTQEQLELKQYIIEDNLNAVKDGMMFTTTDCLEHWASMDVFNIEQFKKHSLIGSYIDLYKEINGIKPRWIDFDAMPYEVLSEALEQLFEELRLERETEAEMNKRYLEEEKERIARNAYIPNNVFSGLSNLLNTN